MESIKFLDSQVKNEIFYNVQRASAYDTAWVAMIPIPIHDHHVESGNGPMFKSCLDWIIENQKEGGFWGEADEIYALPATLACLLALKTWNNTSAAPAHHQNNIDRGLKFIHSKVDIILGNKETENLPRWFILTFPAMIELATAAGLDLDFRYGSSKHIMITAIFEERDRILKMNESVDGCFPPLLSYLLPTAHSSVQPEIVQQYYLSCCDGSLFESPSATAQAFMLTGNIDCINYLKSLVQQFPSGVPSTYTMDGDDLTKLCMVDHLQGLGLADHFDPYIDHTLSRVYRNIQMDVNKTETMTKKANMVQKLFKDALAFRLLRMQGYHANIESFCWFLHEPTIVSENPEQLIRAMYNVYRATHLQFPGEAEIDEARAFSLRVLETTIKRDHSFINIPKGLQNMIEYELSVPWTARLDHLYHRKWIEENKTSLVWTEKASLYRLSSLNNKLLQLAEENFVFRQSIYRQELEELKGWSHKWRLSEMGFGREKTVYSYFVAASSCCLPYDSIMRLVIAKAAIIVTVADDFYDMEGSLSDLEILTDAVTRWDSRGLQGHSKTIFDALDNFVNYIAENYGLPPHERTNVVRNLQHLWRETFVSWMVERRWSSTGYLPSMDEYLTTGMTSIAAHTIALPATDFLIKTNESHPKYHNITKLLMALCRLVNDTQSYQKEEEVGKINFVLLHSFENPNGTIQDSIEYINKILVSKRKEFLEHVLMDEDMDKPCKQIHLSCMKVFQMFFNSANLFDSETALADEVKRAIYIPIAHKPKPKPVLKLSTSLIYPNKKNNITATSSKIVVGFRPIMKHSTTFMIKQPSIKLSWGFV